MSNFIHFVPLENTIYQVFHVIMKTWKVIANDSIKLSELSVFYIFISPNNIYCIMKPLQDNMTLVHYSENMGKLNRLRCMFVEIATIRIKVLTLLVDISHWRYFHYILDKRVYEVNDPDFGGWILLLLFVVLITNSLWERFMLKIFFTFQIFLLKN